MSTYTQIIYQLVFCPKHRKPIMIKESRDKLFKYMSGVIENKKCHLYRINGIEDHLHILFDLHPSVALSDLVKDLKLSSSKFIKENNLFPGFEGWQEGYGAFTYSIREKETLIQYIKNQEEHHRKKSFREEYIQMLEENDVEFEERYVL